MDVKKAAVIGLMALTLLTFVAPAGAWFGPFGGCGSLFPFGLFGYPVPVPVPVPVSAPLCAPGPCDIGAPGLGLGGWGLGNNLAIPGPA